MRKRSLSLTSRELQILQSIQQGLTTKQIALKYTRSIKTIEKHATHILVKLDTHSRLEAVYKAQQLGLLDCPCPCHSKVVLDEQSPTNTPTLLRDRTAFWRVRQGESCDGS